MSKRKKIRFIIHYVKPTAQLLFKNSPAEYPSWVARCDIKGSVSTVLNPIFSKKVQGQTHPGSWGIVEHHPSIILLSKSKTQLVNQRKQKVAFSPGTAHSPEIQSYRAWWDAASPILNDTPVVYTSYNRTHIRNAHTHTYIHIYIYTYIYIYILIQSVWTVYDVAAVNWVNWAGNEYRYVRHILYLKQFENKWSSCLSITHHAHSSTSFNITGYSHLHI